MVSRFTNSFGEDVFEVVALSNCRRLGFNHLPTLKLAQEFALIDEY